MGTRPLLLLLALLVLALVSFPTAVFADGMAYQRSREAEPLHPLYQEKQWALIAHHNGIEHLLIAISILPGQDENEAFWLFPVPGSPDTVDIDLVDQFPVLRGEQAVRESRRTFHATLWFARGAVINPVLGAFIGVGITVSMSIERASSGVRLHGAVEKHGLRAETMRADSLDALAVYLKDRGVEIAREDLDGFEPYLNDDYVLIATRIASIEQLRAEFGDLLEPGLRGMGGRRPCIYVTFPAERAFYPMRPTAAYGDVPIAVDLSVIGDVRPQGDGAMLAKARFRVCVDADADHALFPAGMLDGIAAEAPLLYTRVAFGCPASVFTGDLTFEPRRGLLCRFRGFAASTTGRWVVVIVVVSLIGYLSGGICGGVYFRRWHPHAFYGLLGIFTASLPAVLVYRRRGKSCRGVYWYVGAALLVVAACGAVFQAIAHAWYFALAILFLLGCVLLYSDWPYWDTDDRARRTRYARTYIAVYIALTIPAEVLLCAALRS
ncbi:MAG: hypothetical protein JW889_06130 [Verrucomicrobia bacterium]|nr:hypothetical protein [Verrucomicrobiota bacterium]